MFTTVVFDALGEKGRDFLLEGSTRRHSVLRRLALMLRSAARPCATARRTALGMFEYWNSLVNQAQRRV